MEIKRNFERKEKARASKMWKQGCRASQTGMQRERLEQEMMGEVMKLNWEWEKMWVV